MVQNICSGAVSFFADANFRKHKHAHEKNQRRCDKANADVMEETLLYHHFFASAEVRNTWQLNIPNANTKTE